MDKNNTHKSSALLRGIILSLIFLLALLPAKTSQARRKYSWEQRGRVTKSKFGTLKKKDLKRAGASSCKNLMIVAHPDDEMLWGGAHLLEDKWFVVCITEGYNRRRANEFRKVLKMTKDKGIILNYADVRYHIRYDWKTSRKGIAKDLQKVLRFKKWSVIATHNPEGEYGHIQHLLTNQIVTDKCKKKALLQRLYYFGHFYLKGEVPDDEPKISKKALKEKHKILKVYKSQKIACMKNLRHMWPYENWQSAYELYNSESTKSIEDVYPYVHLRKLQARKKKLLQMENRLYKQYTKKGRGKRKIHNKALGKDFLKKDKRIRKSLRRLSLKRRALKRRNRLRQLRLKRKLKKQQSNKKRPT